MPDQIPYYLSKKGTKWCMPASGKYFSPSEKTILDKNGFRVFQTMDGERASESKPPVAAGHIN